MLIDIDNLTFRWNAEANDVLDIPALSIAAGKTVFIAGPSGSGKSTLLNILSGVNAPTRGNIQILEQNLAALNHSQRDRFRADHIGFIFQMFNLIPYLSVIDNVCLPCRFSTKRTQAALQQSQSLQAEAQRLLTQLDLTDPTLLQQPVMELSVGQQQRVAAARALMGSPELVIADEPTSALDPDRRQSFIELLFKEIQRTQATLVFVSHDLTLAPMFDQLINLPTINNAAHAGNTGRAA